MLEVSEEMPCGRITTKEKRRIHEIAHTIREMRYFMSLTNAFFTSRTPETHPA
jgi:hypothetical protein